MLIRFMTGIFKKPSKPTIYQALNDAKRAAARLPHVSYRHVTRAANEVADDMARRALEEKGSVVYWAG